MGCGGNKSWGSSFQEETSHTYIYGVFIWKWNRVDGKFWRENRFVYCLVGKRGKKILMWGPDIFHPSPHKVCLSKIKRKLGERSLIVKWQNYLLQCTWAKSSSFFFFLFFPYGSPMQLASFILFIFSFLGVVFCFFLFFVLLMDSWATLPPFFSFDFLGVVLFFLF